MNLAKHPFIVIKKIKDKYSHNLEFEFSEYYHKEKSLKDERKTFKEFGYNINEKYLTNLINKLEPGWELALNSCVIDEKGETYHIPMIDFSNGFDIANINYLNEIFDPDFVKQLILFDSGRSYHGYGTTLINEYEFLRFLGKLLLLNSNGYKIVDARWIGHRLIGGYCALRLSFNNKYYLKLPTLIAHKN